MGEMVDIAIPMLTGASADETVSDPVALNNAKQHIHEIRMTQGSTAGVVKVGLIPTRNFTGEPEWIFEMDATETEIAADLATKDAYRQISFPGTGGFAVHAIKTAMADGTTTSTMRRILTN